MKLLIILITCIYLSFSNGIASQCLNLDEGSPIEKQRIINKISCDPDLAQVLYQMTYDTIQVLDHYQIPYNIMFGSLLGAVRHQAMVPHDDDIDLCFLKIDEKKLVTTTDIFDQLGYRLFVDGSDVGGPNYVGYKLYAKESITLTNETTVTPFVDLFTYIWDEDSQKYVLDAPEGKELFIKSPLKKEWIHEQADYVFGNMVVKGPKNYEEVLNHFYGESWNEIMYVSHLHNTTLKNSYVWKITELDRYPTNPAAPLKERVKEYLNLIS